MADPHQTATDAAKAPRYKTPLPEYIGEAYMLADGEIVMNLRAEFPDGAIGDGQQRFKPSNPNYAMVKAHLGPDLRPGGPSVPVRPFPSE